MKKIFINYSWKHDTKNAEKVYNTLISFPGKFDVWMDKKSMQGGLQWRPAIRKAIREADFFIAVLSCGSVAHRGELNKELYEAVDVWKEFPPNQVFLVPARVEECTSPFEDLAKLNYVDLFPDWNSGMNKLITALDKDLLLKNSVTFTAEKKKTKPDYHYRIGLVDLDLGLKNLKKLIAQLNKVQNYFLFTLPEMPPLKNRVRTIAGVKNF